jgi:hypothetical protein
MKWVGTNWIGLALVALGASGCVKVVKVWPDSGQPAAADSGTGVDGGAGTLDGGSNPDGGAGDPIVTGDPEGSWLPVTGSLASLTTECGTVGAVAAMPSENRLLVGVVKNGVYASTDGGETWTQQGRGAGSVTVGARVTQFAFDPDQAGTYYVGGIYAAPGLLKTTDNGMTFRGLGDVWHNDTFSVDFNDPGRRTLLAGGHEQSRTVWRSGDGGATWKNVGTNLPADSGWSIYVHVVDPQIHLVGAPGKGIYRSTDSGASWSKVSELGGGAAPLLASDQSIYWVTAGGSSLARSLDDGESWEVVTPAGIVHPVAPLELPDGRIATRGPRGVLVSDDQGAHWVVVAPPEPYDPPSTMSPFTYSRHEKAFFVIQSRCAVEIGEDAVLRFDWDFEE